MCGWYSNLSCWTLERVCLPDKSTMTRLTPQMAGQWVGGNNSVKKFMLFFPYWKGATITLKKKQIEMRGWVGNSPDRIRGAVTSARAREIMGVMTLDRLNPPPLSFLVFGWPQFPFTWIFWCLFSVQGWHQSSSVFIFWDPFLYLPDFSSFFSFLGILVTLNPISFDLGYVPL